MGVTVVAGVEGVGVSAVCTAARSALDDGYELVNFGDVMLEQAAVNGLTRSRSELATLTPRETERLQRRAGEYVADRAAEAEVLLSTHLAVRTSEGFLLGFPRQVLADVDPDRFAVVEASPETVAERRGGDASVRRIDFQQDLNRAAAVAYAAEVAAPIEFVDNTGAVEAAAATLVDVLES